MSSFLVIDDDRALARSLEIQLGAEGHEVRSAHTAADGLATLADFTPDIVLLDLKLPDRGGLDLLPRILEMRPGIPVVVITGREDTRAAIDAMRAGAFDYIRKPFDIDDVLLLPEKAARTHHHTADTAVPVEELSADAGEIVGRDRRIVEAVKQIGLLSRSRVTVLIEGETGTGKELAARALHRAADPGKPFVSVNCSAVVPTLFESELFGHEKGAFTGADRTKIGKLEYADDGTVFFDEVGDMPLEFQAKVLRVLQERKFERVGGLEPIRFDARVVAATHRDLESLVRDGRFRQDLFYRLAVSRLALPPLRDRRGDIPLLVRHLLDRIGKSLHRKVDAVEEDALARLAAYDWPGNVRELENVLTRAVALARGPVLTDEEIESSLGKAAGGAASSAAAPPEPSGIRPLRDVERDHILEALTATGWNVTRTAALLQISPTTLRKKIRDFGLRHD